MTERPPTRLIVAGAAGALLAVLAAWFWFSGLGILGDIESLTRGSVRFWVVLLPALPFLALLGVSLLKAYRAEMDGVEERTRRDPYYAYRRTSFEPTRTQVGLGAAAALALLAGLGYSIFVHGYLTNVAWAKGAQVVDEEISYAERGPWNVADRFASRDQGDLVGDRGPVRRVPGPSDEDGTRYTTLVAERHFVGMAGYEAVQSMHMPTVGQIDREATGHCEVPDSMGRKVSSFWPWHNLTHSITAQRPFAHWDSDDAYGYCDADGEPVVVVPLWAYDGWWTVTKVPAGVAVYTPHGLDVMDADEMAEPVVGDDPLAGLLAPHGIEGPTYPTSVAQRQREGLRGMFSFGQYYSRTAGYDLTSKDHEDANLGNTTELILVDQDGRPDYLTPLTPRGSSQSITAVAVVPATQDGTGRVPVLVNTSVDLPATSTIATNIREASISGDSSWTSRWASGMTVYEILPGQDGTWVASIGQGQAVSYRAVIASDGTVEVTNVVTGQTGGDGEVADGGSVPLPEGGLDVSGLTDAELVDLLRGVVDEMDRRQGGPDGDGAVVTDDA